MTLNSINANYRRWVRSLIHPHQWSMLSTYKVLNEKIKKQTAKFYKLQEHGTKMGKNEFGETWKEATIKVIVIFPGLERPMYQQ